MQLTDAISRWMQNEYPTIESGLKEQLEKTQRVHDSFNKSLDERLKNCEKQIVKQINDFIKKDYPNMDTSLKVVAKDLQLYAEKLNKNSERYEMKLNSLVKNNSIYEDVYKIRDEMKEITKFIDGFKKKIAKAFEV